MFFLTAKSPLYWTAHVDQSLSGALLRNEESLEEKTSVITFLVGVVSRYAFNDKRALSRRHCLSDKLESLSDLIQGTLRVTE